VHAAFAALLVPVLIIGWLAAIEHPQATPGQALETR
jgi:hypothetical protein